MSPKLPLHISENLFYEEGRHVERLPEYPERNIQQKSSKKQCRLIDRLDNAEYRHQSVIFLQKQYRESQKEALVLRLPINIPILIPDTLIRLRRFNTLGIFIYNLY